MRARKDDLAVWDQVYTQNVYDLPAAFVAGAVVVDIGGHVGAFTKACLERGAKVIAAEACLDNCKEFELSTGHPVRHAAVVGAANEGRGRLRYAPGRESYAASMELWREGPGEDVELLPLADLVTDVPEIELLKIDCEGSEYDIVEHSAEVLARTKAIVAECHWVEGWREKYARLREQLRSAGLVIRYTKDTPAPTVYASRPGGLWSRYRVLLGVPSDGRLHDSSAQASFLASFDHDVDRLASSNSGPNFNTCWCAGLNASRQKRCTHFGMIHADLAIEDTEPGRRWLDMLIEEMEKAGADFISVPMAIKDARGLTSSGIGNPSNRWNPWRRFTKAELESLPVTFNARDIGYGDKFLLHNHALCVWDMRKPIWQQPNTMGHTRAVFNFSEKIELVGEEWVRWQESEDWAFSRDLWAMGAQTVITRRVHVIHHGGMGFPNHGTGGLWEHDDATQSQWQNDKPLAYLESAPVALAAQPKESNGQCQMKSTAILVSP